jgi:streptogramin lyase
MNGPRGIAIDTAGNIFVADANNNVIRKINTAGIITTVAGNYTAGAGYSGNNYLAVNAQLDSPYAVAVDNRHNLYINDYKNNTIRRVDTVGVITGYVDSATTTGYAGDNGYGGDALIHRPAGIAVDTAGNLFIADATNNVIRKVTAATGKITTVAGNGSAGFGGDLGNALGANLLNPFGVAVDVYGNIYIADANNQRIRKVYNPLLQVNSVFVNNNSFDLFPNPSSDNVMLSGLETGDHVSVYDLAGKQVCAWQAAAAGTQTFEIRTLSAGMYQLRVSDANGITKAFAKLVKE